MKRLCTICARAGSKGVKNKNVRLLLGKPLISYSILQAKATKIFDCIGVSSDSEEILSIAKSYGADFLIQRPEELATDEAPKIPAIRHCFSQVELKSGCNYDTIVDLDATSPLRIPEDILEVIRILEEKQVSNVITAAPARRSPYFNLVEVDRQGVVHVSKTLPGSIFRRQDSPQCYDMNASIYAWQRSALLNFDTVFLKDTILYVMPPERSIDIDEELDFEIVEFLLRRRG